MNLIEQLGGYDAAKEKYQSLSDSDVVTIGPFEVPAKPYFKDELLEYRRQHNIFEVGDKVVSINSAFIEYQGVLNIDFIDKFNLMLSDDSKGFEVNAICGWSKIIRHATDEEIKAGKRLEVAI
ncbi:hypothetical protein [Acinetobacter sp. YH12144]|uniref:hypothetical protein n=1 Tax=Acinetobacter sp. YH12144 TaxID=2601128 RepID=UPI0015D20EAD|nr:hypothetical protein [Acinetobacter sp. YH12144]